MSDPLEKLLKRAESWEPPPADAGAVKGRGKTLRLRRAAFSGLAGLLIVGAAGGGTFLLSQERTESFVSKVNESETPEMRAKVARFAFHALIETGPYELDYKGIEKSDGGWVTTFVSGPTVSELETRLLIAEDTVDEFKSNIQKLENRITGVERLARVDGRAKERELRDLKEQLRISQRFSLPAAKKDVRQFAKQLDETVKAGGPQVTEITVEAEEDTFHVEGLSGPYEEEQREAIANFTEEIPERAVGYEFFNIDLITRDGLSWEGLVIYVGPIPSDDIHRCGLELYDENDRLVARTPESRYWESGGVDSEERRDGMGQVGPLNQVARSLPPESELVPVTVCIPVMENRTSDDSSLDRLKLDLILESDEVASGGKIGSQLSVRNDSARQTIVDPACHLSAWTFGLVPAGQPDAGVWQQIVTDCEGSFEMEPGFSRTGTTFDFFARTRTGEPLQPGEYYAVVEIQGRSERLVEPVTVTE